MVTAWSTTSKPATMATTEPGDACTNDCQVATCGDKVLRTDLTPGEVGAESCDDGNEVDTGRLPSTCARWRPAATDSADWI